MNYTSLDNILWPELNFEDMFELIKNKVSSLNKTELQSITVTKLLSYVFEDFAKKCNDGSTWTDVISDIWEQIKSTDKLQEYARQYWIDVATEFTSKKTITKQDIVETYLENEKLGLNFEYY